MSTLDDPLMWGFKGFPTMNAKLGRWVPAAEDICFKNAFYSYLFRLASGEESATDNNPKHGSEWVDLFVREMMNASDMDDARTRASRALEVLEKSIVAHVNVEAAQHFNKESMIMKEQVETLLRENTILKTAVTIQHERQKDYDEKNQELQQLKQLVSQYQEQLSKLEVNNYALAMHLRQAQHGSSIPGRFHPDVF